jgi:hypothetical protein
MEKQFIITVNGQEVRDEDFNLLGEMSGLADDRVFAEIFRPIGNNGFGTSKYIMPWFDMADSTTPNIPGRQNEVVFPGAVGTVRVRPFRAVIGSTTQPSTDSKKYLQDIRSAIFAGTTPNPYTAVSITANSSGNSRIDLIYVIFSPNINSASVTRKTKDPVTKAISSSSISVSLTSSVSIARVQGTPAASPTVPALPADGGGNYYIALAYVRVPPGFSGTSLVQDEDILHVSPCIELSTTTGATTVRPASGNVLASSTKLSAWANSGVRPNFVLPSTMIGEETIWIALDCTDGSTANWSHLDNGIVDNSRDWRNRIFSWTAVAGTGQYAWAVLGGSMANEIPAGDASTIGSRISFGFGESFNTSSSQRPVALINSTNMSILTNGSAQLYVDPTTGELKIDIIAGPMSHKLLIKLSATAPFHNT